MLTHKIAFYVPSTYNVDKKAPASIINSIVDNCISFLSLNFGGSTVSKVYGTYRTKYSHKIVKEDITYIYAYADELTAKKVNTAKKICHYICKALKQESVALEIDNTLQFIE